MKDKEVLKEVLVERWANEFDKRSDYANVKEESSLLCPEQYPESMYELEEERIKLFIKEIIEDIVDKLERGLYDIKR